MAEESDKKFLYAPGTPKKFLYADVGGGDHKFLFAGPSIVLPVYPTNAPVGCGDVSISFQFGGTKTARRYDMARIQWTVTPTGTSGNYTFTETNGATFCAVPKSGDNIMYRTDGFPPNGYTTIRMHCTVYDVDTKAPNGISGIDAPASPNWIPAGMILNDNNQVGVQTAHNQGYAYATPMIESRDLGDTLTQWEGAESCARSGVNIAGQQFEMQKNLVNVPNYDPGGLAQCLYIVGHYWPVAIYKGNDGGQHKWDLFMFFCSTALRYNGSVTFQTVDSDRLFWYKKGVVGTANGVTVTDDPGDGAGTYYDFKEPFYDGSVFLCGVLVSGPDTSGCGACYGTSEASCEELDPESPEYWDCYDCWWMCADTYYTITPPNVSMIVSRTDTANPLITN